MGIECCGVDRATPFCPMCGKGIDGHNVLYGLLTHIHRTVVSYEHRKQARLASVDNDKDAPYVKTIEKKMKKWTQWEAALTHAISLVDCEKEEPVAI